MVYILFSDRTWQKAIFKGWDAADVVKQTMWSEFYT